MDNFLDYSLIITTKKRYRQIDTNINRKSFHTHPSLPPLPSLFSIYKIRGGEHSPPLPSFLAIYRCTHRISSVNACVYLSAKILPFFETSKLFIIFFKSLAHALFQVTQDMSQHHHKQNYMWLNVCNLPEKKS